MLQQGADNTPKAFSGRTTLSTVYSVYSLWFVMACMLQQGADNTPKAASGIWRCFIQFKIISLAYFSPKCNPQQWWGFRILTSCIPQMVRVMISVVIPLLPESSLDSFSLSNVLTLRVPR
jgi:hypothetical protein